MRIIVAGGTGFLGTALVRSLRDDGNDVKVLTRRPRDSNDVGWAPEHAGGWAATLEGCDAVVNLAGEGIADQSWSAARKAAILNSRVTATGALAAAIRACATPPSTFISASGVGYYGTRGGELLTEEAPPGSDFLATVCQAWERETEGAGGIARIVLLRTGLVLARDGGALPRMALPFRFFVGGRVGTGQQYVSWIHVDDWVQMVRWALHDAKVSSALNVTAPSPVTNAEFTQTLAGAMHRPALVPAPAAALRALLGKEMADALLLEGQRAIPAKAQALGFQFRYPTVQAALAAIYS